MRKRLDVQKDEYEETIKRHLSFIDQVNVFVNIFIFFFCKEIRSANFILNVTR